ncbi:glyoxalase [Agromyces aureus]|uniref:Glyoxalase n=1 Tax=Agromyces aureus TaxID=453304 RepID=A0A191WKJ9_9MICO|nr:glyoxalase [Agromyces aureus]ANJ28698.1 glyoxalase [Agromyces aureus]
MNSIDHIIIEATDVTAAEAFYDTAFGLGERVRVRRSDAATSGFRGFTLSLVVSQPANVSALFNAALAAGATAIKPVAKSMWGVGGTLRAPDGTIWKIATTAKKDTVPASRDVDAIVLLLGSGDVKVSKRYYVGQGLVVGKSFGAYAEFTMDDSPIRLGLYARKALAKDAGVPLEGTGSHRIVIAAGASAATDPDGFAWEPAAVAAPLSRAE